MGKSALNSVVILLAILAPAVFSLEITSCLETNSTNQTYYTGCQCANFDEIPSGDGVCLYCQVTNCRYCDPQNENLCDICQGDYKLTDDYQCEQVCPSGSPPSTCECPATSVLKANGECVDCDISNCLLCQDDDQTICDLCQPGYFLFENSTKCTSCAVENCEICSAQNTDECEKCYDGFEYDSDANSCSPPVCQNGQIFKGEEGCVCPDQQYLSDGSCVDCPQKCDECDADGCTKCSSGYYLTMDNTCSQCMENCKFCQDAISCTACISGYTLANSQCIQIPKEIKGFLIISGFYARCLGGCSDCSAVDTCNKCARGLFLQGNNKCKSCDKSCLTCSISDKKVCTSCYEGYNMVGYTCVMCASNCMACLNSNYCIACDEGYYLENGKCSTCNQNCVECSDAKTCTLCDTSFTPVNGRCIQCLLGCGQCSSANIAECYNCIDGYYLESETCKSCPTGCRTCESSTVCTSCSDGYYMDGDLCYENCQFPCSKCSHTDPTSCTECYLGYTLNSNACDPKLECTTGETCVCPLGYAVVGDACSKCTYTDSNCATCSTDNLAECTSCKSGYYLLDEACISCSTGCAVCDSEQYCLSCSDGYFLKHNGKEPLGVCEACSSESYCKTCQKSPTQCTSCLTGFTLREKQCRSNKWVKVKFVFTIIITKFTAQIYNFKLGLLSMLGGNFIGRTHLVSFVSLKNGSTIVESELTIPEGGSPEDAYTILTEQLTAGTKIGDLQLAENSEVSAENFDPPEGSDQTTNEEETNLGLILGLSIPLGILCLILIFYFMSRANASRGNKAEQSMESGQKLHGNHMGHEKL